MLQSEELNRLVSQVRPLPDLHKKSPLSPTLRNTSSPSFLTTGGYPEAAINGLELNSQSHDNSIENEHKLWASEKESLQKQIQVIIVMLFL